MQSAAERRVVTAVGEAKIRITLRSRWCALTSSPIFSRRSYHSADRKE
ncbi:hypothetical protein DNTS_007205, partial [Danionella cerebrum]